MGPGRKLTAEENRLVQDNIGLARHLFWQYLSKFQKGIDFAIDQDELLSQAYLGLIRAAMRYRAYGEEHGYSKEVLDKGEGFSYFARKSIIGQMIDSLRKIDHVHTLVRKDYKSLVAAGLGATNVSEDDLSEKTGLSVERIQRVVKSVNSRPVSLSEGADEHNQYPLEDQISQSDDIESSATVIAVRTAFVEKVDDLPALQQVIIVLKYYSNMELPAIAEELGVTLTKVRNCHTQALVSLHAAMHSTIQETI